MIKIKSVKTKYGIYVVGETFLNKWGMWNPTYEVWRKEKVSGEVKWVCGSSEKIVTEDEEFYGIDEIRFYPKKNKFVAMSKGEKIAFMVSKEYTVVVE